MGISLDLPLDAEWGVSVGDDDGGWSSVTLHDGQDGHEVTVRGTTERLVGLLEAALRDLVDAHVRQETDRRQETLRRHAEEVMAFAERELVAERNATPDEMESGGWVRMPGGPRWWRIGGLATCGLNHHGGPQGCRLLALNGYESSAYHVAAHITLPYRTADEMAAEAPIPSDTWADEGDYRAELRAKARAEGTDTNGRRTGGDENDDGGEAA